MTQRAREGLKRLAERPGTVAEGKVAREMLEKGLLRRTLDVEGFMRDMDLYLMPEAGRVQ